LKALKIEGKRTLVLTNGKQENVWKSGRNIYKVKVLEAQNAAPYQILNNQVLLVQKSAIKILNNQAAQKEVVS